MAAVETEEGEVQNDSDLIDGILAGYATDDWFADTANIQKEGLRLENGAYWKVNALAVPAIPVLKQEILHELHDASYAWHVGIHRTHHSVKWIYWWPNMAKDIREYVKGV